MIWNKGVSQCGWKCSQRKREFKKLPFCAFAVKKEFCLSGIACVEGHSVLEVHAGRLHFGWEWGLSRFGIYLVVQQGHPRLAGHIGCSVLCVDMRSWKAFTTSSTGLIVGCVLYFCLK